MPKKPSCNSAFNTLSNRKANYTIDWLYLSGLTLKFYLFLVVYTHFSCCYVNNSLLLFFVYQLWHILKINLHKALNSCTRAVICRLPWNRKQQSKKFPMVASWEMKKKNNWKRLVFLKVFKTKSKQYLRIRFP